MCPYTWLSDLRITSYFHIDSSLAISSRLYVVPKNNKQSGFCIGLEFVIQGTQIVYTPSTCDTSRHVPGVLHHPRGRQTGE